jgi:ribosomal protein S3AE
MIRKGTDYVEDSFIAECKDASLKIKPFLITRRKVSKRVRRGLREKAKQEIIKYLKDKPSQKIFEEILKNKMQKDLSILLKKIYPLALCEIKSIEIKKDLEVKVKEKPKEEKQEKEEDIQEKKEKKSKKKEEKEADSKEN